MDERPGRRERHGLRGCRDAAQDLQATDKSTWAKWHWAGTASGVALDVKIESGFSFTGSTVYKEDSLPASSPDTDQLGCDTSRSRSAQSRDPGLGSVVSSNKLETSIRSVGRVKTVPGSSAPALLLLKRTGCPALRAGNSGSGSGTFIHVLGAMTATGLSQPGTIHSDSDGAGCTGGSNSNVFIGAQNDGIVAYAAPLVSNPSSPDPMLPGFISSVAAANGAAQNVIRDSLDYVYGSSALTTGGTKNEVSPRPLVTRKLVDDRYFTGVKAALSGAASVFAAGASGPIATWKKFPASVNACSPTQANVDALTLTAADDLYIDCNTGPKKFNAGNLTIPAGRIYFRNWVAPAGHLLMPNATKVYVGNHTGVANAIDIGNASSFQMNNAAANMSGGLCSSAVNAALTKGTLFVNTGSIAESNGGLLRLCRTTAFMMGGRSDGCVPATSGNAPTITPCAGTLGTSQFTQTGGDIDWTAPNSLDTTLNAVTKVPLPAAVTAWQDANGPEDLALWSESATSTSQTYNMNGGGVFNVRGVFMVPNADPFKISGGAGMNLTNAQYIVASIELNGGTQITMKVDPNSAIVLPDLDIVGLIR